MDDAENEQGSNLNVSDIELESDQESETKSSDSDDIVLADYNRSTDNVRDINIFAFSGPQPGPTQTLEANKKELDFLNLLFPEKSYSKISEETLMRMLNSASDLKQILNGTTQPLGKYVLFLNVKSFWGLLSAPAQDLYFSKDKLFHLSCIEERFTRTRFENIQRYFHMANTTKNLPKNQPGHFKISNANTTHIKKFPLMRP